MSEPAPSPPPVPPPSTAGPARDAGAALIPPPAETADTPVSGGTNPAETAQARTDRLCGRVAWGILLFMGVAMIASAPQIGITTDEPIRSYTGRNWWKWLQTHDPQYLPSDRLKHYGAVWDMIGVAASDAWTAIGGADEYLPKHLLNGLAAWLGLLGVYRLAGVLGPQPLPVFALAAMALMPRFVGSLNNPKDVPFATAFTWSAYAMIVWLRRPSAWSTLGFAFAAAACAAIRPYGALWMVLGPPAALAAWWFRFRQRAGDGFTAAHPSAGHAVGFVMAAGLLTFALWPTLWITPPTHLMDSLQFLSKFPDGGSSLYFGKVFERDGFLGQTVDIPLPWGGSATVSAHASYMPVWTAVTVPETTVLACLAGLVFLAGVGVRSAVRRARGGPAAEPVTVLGVPAWGWAIPVIWLVGTWVAAVIRGVHYGRTSRHFFFLLPAVAVLAGLAFALATVWLRRVRLGWVPVLAGTVAAGDVLVTCARIHPFESLYFSRLIGGLPGAVGRLDVENWGQSLKEAFEKAAELGGPGAKVHAGLGNDPMGGHDTSGWNAGRAGVVLNPPDPDWFISIVLQGREKRFPGRVAATVDADGVPLAVIVRLDPWVPAGEVMAGPPGGRLRKLRGNKGGFDLKAAGVTVPKLKDYAAEDEGGTEAVVVWRLHAGAAVTVPILVGLKGPGALQVNDEEKPRRIGDRLRNQPHDAFAGMHRIDVPLRAGENVLRLTGVLRHDTRVYVHHVEVPGRPEVRHLPAE